MPTRIIIVRDNVQPSSSLVSYRESRRVFIFEEYTVRRLVIACCSANGEKNIITYI